MAAVSVQCRGAVLKTTVLLFSRSDGPEIDLFDPVGFSVVKCEISLSTRSRPKTMDS